VFADGLAVETILNDILNCEARPTDMVRAGYREERM
jgi:hypothetical protein